MPKTKPPKAKTVLTMPRKVGRPSLFSEELAQAICERIAGGEGLREICRDETMPHREAVRRWLMSNEKFRGQYAYAREMQADFHAEELLEIADDATNDWMRRNGKEDEPGWVVNSEHIQRSRTRIDTRKWLMSKLAPKRYGEKLAIGGDADAPAIQTAMTVRFIKPEG